MIWNERNVITAVCRQVLQRKCLLLVDNCSWPGAECDVLGVTTDLRIIDVEVKISRADLKADARKEKWWHVPSYTEALESGLIKRGDAWDPWGHKTPRRWPRRVWKHYYAMPEAIWKDELLAALPSSDSGVILLREQQHRPHIAVARVARRSKPDRDAYRLKPEQVMDIARLANLRMWDAYEQVERMADDHRRERALAA